jgi:para-nitrobenzyl esterase
MLFTCGFALTACGSSRGANGKLIELIVRLSKTEEIEMKNLKFKPSFVLTIVVILVGCLTPAFAQDPTIVKVEGGTVKGVTTANVISWKSIPYAAPPVGELRWRNPQPAKPWNSVFDASKIGPACMQTDDIPKSEDCLTLNVWRPATRRPSHFP